MIATQFWESAPSGPLGGLAEAITGASGRNIDRIEQLTAETIGSAPLVAVFAGSDDISAVRALEKALRQTDQAVVIVIDDGWIGTDTESCDTAITGAAAITLARSLAARRDKTARLNVVSIPDSLLGAPTVHRGPLPGPVTPAEIAAVIDFLLSDEASYIAGQVLFADGGRHLFSSLTA